MTPFARAVWRVAALCLLASPAVAQNQLPKVNGPSGPVYAAPSAVVNPNGGSPCVVGAAGCPLPVTVTNDTSGGATAANQVTGNASLATIATNTTGAATATAQATANASLASIATNTAAGATASNQATANTALSAIQTNTTGASTAANQTTANTALAAIQTSTAAGATSANQASQITQETAINTVLGTVTASPTANTIADRLKTINTTLGTPMQATGGTVTANIGTTGGLALNTTVAGLQVSQGSTTSGQSGDLVQAATVSGDQAYTAGQTNALTVTASGRLRVGLSSAGGSAPGTAGTNSDQIGCVYTAAGITLTNGQQAACQFDSTGHILVSDPNNAPFSGVTDMPTDGTTYAAGRSFQAECTIAGKVKVTFSDASTRTIPLNIGLTILPYAVTKWTLTAVSGPATCTYANDK